MELATIRRNAGAVQRLLKVGWLEDQKLGYALLTAVRTGKTDILLAVGGDDPAAQSAAVWKFCRSI